MVKKGKKMMGAVCLAIAMVVLCSSVMPGTSFITEVQAASNVKQIVLKNGVTKNVQLDNTGEKEKISFKISKKEISRDEDFGEIYYRMTYQIKVNGNVIVKKTWKEQWFDDWETASIWKKYYERHAVVITDIDKSDGVKDILYIADNNTKYRMQYKNGKKIVNENLDKRIEALKLPTVVNDRFAIMDDGTIGFSGRASYDDRQVSYKNGEWKYSDKDSGTIYQLTTTGDGTAKWAVCLSVADLGYMHVTIPLKLKNNKLVLASETLSGDVLETGCSGGVNKTMTVYTAAGGNKTAFTATKGNVVEFVSYKIIGNKVYVQVKNEEGKLGWIGEKQFACIEFDGVLQ